MIVINDFFLFYFTEIPNFFTDEECEMIIEMGQEKGLKESPLSQDSQEIINKDSLHDVIKNLDKNNDDFLDKKEVRTSPYYFLKITSFVPLLSTPLKSFICL